MPNSVVHIFADGIYEEGVYCGYFTDKIDRLDLINKRIYLRSGVVEYHPVDDIYKEVRFIRKTDTTLRVVKTPVSAGGNVNKGGGKATPRYAIFNNGWKVVPQNIDHTLYIKGEQITDDGQSGPACIDTLPLSEDTRVIIQYEPPAAEIIVQVAQLAQIEHASFNNEVTIDQTSGSPGTAYPIGTEKDPVSNWTDALAISTERGLSNFYLKGSFTLGSTDNITAYAFRGQGATLNVFRTTVTLTQGCITTNSQWHDCKITGYQGGESLYTECIIDGLDNAHCMYEKCGLLDGTSRGYTIRQTSAVSSGHASYFKECFSDEGTAILDRNGGRLNVTFDGFHGRLKIINQNHATSSGQCWIHLNGGTVTIDSSCTKGKITITGFGSLINQSAGTEVDASGFASEVAAQARLDVESIRKTHQGFGARFYVDPVNGTDLAPGNSPSSPVRTVNIALSKAVSGRGDVIYLLAPGAGTTTIDERVVVNKEDVHIRGPGRGIQFQPSTSDSATPIINVTANNCSFSGFIVRSNTGETAGDAIVVSGKFSRFDKLYMVGPGQSSPANTCRGLVFTGGDYHELYDMEIEKYGDSGIALDDKSDTHSNGSPREISIFGGNIYLNGGHGMCLHGKDGSALGSTSRLIRVLGGVNIHDNLSYGIHIDDNVLGVVIDSSVLLHNNNGGSSNPQTNMLGTYYDKNASSFTQQADTVWSHSFVSKLLTVAKFLGLK